MAVIMERVGAATERAGVDRALPAALVFAAILVAVGWLTGAVLGSVILAAVLVVGTVVAQLEHRALRLGEVAGLGALHLVALLAL